jgi:hypothetical protein
VGSKIGDEENSVPLQRFEPQTDQPIAYSLNRLRYGPTGSSVSSICDIQGRKRNCRMKLHCAPVWWEAVAEFSDFSLASDSYSLQM